MASPYLVPVARMLRGDRNPIVVSFRAPFDAAHEFAPRGSAECDVAPDAEVEVAITLEGIAGGILARGRVSAPWRGICRRCSKAIDGVVVARVAERYVEDPPASDEEAYAIDGDFVDLLSLVHDAVLLELPIAPLCREDCAGICPICGADRNEEPCECQPGFDPRWATLDALRGDDVAST